MQILGISSAPQEIRYAVVSFDGTAWTLLNRDTESRLRPPASATEDGERLRWVRAEYVRILRAHPDIALIGLKTSEYVGTESATKRKCAYLDAAVLLVGAESGIRVVPRLYSQMGATRATVLERAETRVGRTDRNWNQQMADAVAVAWSVGQ
jgi:hypothetical protein